ATSHDAHARAADLRQQAAPPQQAAQQQPPAPASAPAPAPPEWRTEPSHERGTDPGAGMRMPPAAPPPERQRTAPPYLPPVESPTRESGPRRTRVVAASALAVLLVAGLAGGAYLLTRPEEKKNSARAAAPAFPTTAMVVRIDTRPGWPKSCHADIGTYKAGDAEPVALVRGPQCDMLPVRSPDGTRIAFTRRIDGRSEAWVMNADGSGQRKVTDIAGGRLTWSPDSTRLAYMGEKDGGAQIFAVALQGKAVTQLTTDSSDKDDPMWSSTGRVVFWSKRDGIEQLFTLDPGRPSAPWTKLSRDRIRAVDPAWSPDGKQIAYTRGPSAQSDIWVMDANGANARPLAASADHEMDPGWSRDGRWVCYVRGQVARPEVRAIKADGTGDRTVSPAGKPLGHPSW
ncbi:hypothetical protein E1298_43540, partial [Actinomadura rubrisoli]